jgi:glycine betaine/proline transport system ATP-binding protein
MTPLTKLKHEGLRVQLDWTGHHWLQLDATGQPERADIEGRPGQLLAYHPQMDIVQAGLDGRSIAMAGPDMLLEHIIHIRHATGRPVLLCEAGRFVGVVGDEEIYRGMLQSTRG